MAKNEGTYSVTADPLSLLDEMAIGMQLVGLSPLYLIYIVRVIAASSIKDNNLRHLYLLFELYSTRLKLDV